MKNLKRCLVLAGVTFWVASASAQNPTYSSKAVFLKGRLNVSASSVATPKVAKRDISSKPWLYPDGFAGKERALAASVELQTLSADNYNTKKAARGERGVDFELAPLK